MSKKKQIPKSITKKIRFEVFKRDSFTCQYCGKSAPEVILHVDHIEPKSKGGTNELFNLITACFDCNMGKKDRKLDDSTVLKKQKEELDKLNIKRQQLEMLMEYRKSLIEDVKNEVDVLDQELQMLTGYGFSESYKKDVFKYIKKYGLTECLKGLNTAYCTYTKTGTKEEVQEMLTKLSGILYNKSKEADDPLYGDAVWCANIARKVWRYMGYGDWNYVYSLAHDSLEKGISKNEIIKVIYESSNLNEFTGMI